MGSMIPTSRTTRSLRLVRLALALGRTCWEARRHAGAVGSRAWRRTVERSSGRMLAAVGVEVRVQGARPLLAGPVLLVANHVSWIDVQALGVVAGARFVAKAEVRAWPVVGAMAERLGTVFLRRGSRCDAMRVKNLLAKMLVTGERVVVFPEGTTTDGSRLDPFHAALLQAAVDAAIPVQPVAIRHLEADGTPSTAAAFIGDMTFVTSLARVLERPTLTTELVFGAPIWAADKSRRELTSRCRAFIAGVLGLAEARPVSAVPAVIRRARRGPTPSPRSLRSARLPAARSNASFIVRSSLSGTMKARQP
jgi:1-acyl-sn-glycerol-3-phosphate acyltransferase